MTESDQQTKLDTMRHSFAHVLAMAVMRLYPNVKLGIGPVVENGFYHDFEFLEPIRASDLNKIEAEINKIIEEELHFKQIFVPKVQAFDILHLQGQIYKTEILNSIQDQEVSFYKTGQEFMDLCRGPHVDHTGKLGAFKLINISGTHWNNDTSRPEMQRISGLAFETQADLDEYLIREEEKLTRDHKKLCKQLDLVAFNDANGKGLPLWLPKGESIKKNIENYVYKENLKYNYSYVSTPIISKKSLYEDGIYSNTTFNLTDKEGEGYVIQPTHISHHIQIFNNKKRSYRELPFKLAEFAKISRNEQSGELNGLLRTRNYTVDANTIICTKDQLKKELLNSLKLSDKLFKDFGLNDYKLEISLRGQNNDFYEGNPKEWARIEDLLSEVVKLSGLNAVETPNTADKSGPGLVFKLKDIHDKYWKLGSLIIDINASKRYNLQYTNDTNKSKEAYLITRSGIGSIERFFAILIEHLDGIFPVWLSPVQINIIPISEKYIEYGSKVMDKLIDYELNVNLNSAPETMQNKIRESQENMIPYMLILGEKEEETETISVRPRSGQDLGMMKIEEFVDKIKDEIENKIIF